MDLGLILTIVAVAVAGLAAALGIWMERDPNRPPRWAYGLTVLIVLSTIVTVATSYLDRKQAEEDQRKADEMHAADQKSAQERYTALKRESELLQEAAADSKKREEKMAEDIARMLVKLNEMAAGSDDPALNAFVSTELNSVARANEEVVQKVAQRIKDQGGNPDEMLSKHLPPDELQRVTRAVVFRPPASLAGGRAPAGDSAPAAGFAGRRPGGLGLPGRGPLGQPRGPKDPAAGSPAAGGGSAAPKAGPMPRIGGGKK